MGIYGNSIEVLNEKMFLSDRGKSIKNEIKAILKDNANSNNSGNWNSIEPKLKKLFDKSFIQKPQSYSHQYYDGTVYMNIEQTESHSYGIIGNTLYYIVLYYGNKAYSVGILGLGGVYEYELGKEIQIPKAALEYVFSNLGKEQTLSITKRCIHAAYDTYLSRPVEPIYNYLTSHYNCRYIKNILRKCVKFEKEK